MPRVVRPKCTGEEGGGEKPKSLAESECRLQVLRNSDARVFFSSRKVGFLCPAMHMWPTSGRRARAGEATRFLGWIIQEKSGCSGNEGSAEGRAPKS